MSVDGSDSTTGAVDADAGVDVDADAGVAAVDAGVGSGADADADAGADADADADETKKMVIENAKDKEAESRTSCVPLFSIGQMWPFFNCPHFLHRYFPRDFVGAGEWEAEFTMQSKNENE